MDTALSQRVAGLSRMAVHTAPTAGLRLTRKVIYILPTFQGVVFGFGALTVMLIAMVERNPVALLLAGLMLSVFLLGLVLCYRNVSGLSLQGTHWQGTHWQGTHWQGTHGTQGCFPGDNAQFDVQINTAGPRRAHRGLLLGLDADSLTEVSLKPGRQHALTLTARTTSRGVFSAPRLLLRTVYPAGLWRAWSRPDLAMTCLVYPRPLPCALPDVISPVSDVGSYTAFPSSLLQRGGVDDFAGLREYQAGDSLRHIAWQSLARGQGLKTRQFVREPDQALMLDWDMFVSGDGADNKERILSCLCFQIIELSQQNKLIGLRMPGLTVKPAQGDGHKHRLLEVLALWP